MLVLVIDSDFIMQDGVKAHVFEICYLLHGAKVVVVAIAQGEDGAAGAKHLFPEVRKGGCWRAGINLNLLLCTGGGGAQKHDDCQD